MVDAKQDSAGTRKPWKNGLPMGRVTETFTERNVERQEIPKGAVITFCRRKGKHVYWNCQHFPRNQENLAYRILGDVLIADRDLLEKVMWY